VKAMTIGEFKSRFSEALDAVRKGESITVTFGRKRKAVAIVSPVPAKGTKRPLGLLAGKARIVIADDWEINDSKFLGT
jgi:antitoxin (DNA-binding transcriptional repressor) of toxin-antitoxin stability system